MTPAQQFGPLRPTTARWLNRRIRLKVTHDGDAAERWSKVLAHTGPYTQFAYGCDHPSEWNRPDLQVCFVCSPQAGVFAIDVDDPDEYATTELARYVGREHALSERGSGFHILVDARGIPPELWPGQGEIRGANGLHAGDIKSNGFIPVPGSHHYSGELYKPVLHQGLSKVLDWSPEILAAIKAAQHAPSAEPSGGHSGRNSGGGHDDQVKDQVITWIRQAVNQGYDPASAAVKEAIYQAWRGIAIPRNPAWPFTRDDFERHYGDRARGALAKVLATPAPDLPAEVFEEMKATMTREHDPDPVVTGDVVHRPAATVAQQQPRTPVDCKSGRGPEVVRAVGAALNARVIPQTYVTGGRVVAVQPVSGSPDMDGSRPLPVAAGLVDAHALTALLAWSTFTFRWAKKNKDADWEQQEFSPEARFLTAALVLKFWPGLLPLNGIIGAPVLRPDGSLLQQPGYDPRTGLILAPRVNLDPIPVPPPPEAVAWARNLLFDQVLHNFPWVGQADKANYIAMLATQMLRRRLGGAPVPFFSITATDQSSGKTLLATIAGVLFGKASMTWTGDDEELRKALTSMLASQEGVITFDNVPEGTAIRSGVLSKLLTDRTWADRMLGGNVIGKFANDRLWCATGNNLRLAATWPPAPCWSASTRACRIPTGARGS